MNFLVMRKLTLKMIEQNQTFWKLNDSYLPFFFVLFELRYAPCRYPIPGPGLPTINSDQFSLLYSLNISFILFTFSLCIFVSCSHTLHLTVRLFFTFITCWIVFANFSLLRIYKFTHCFLKPSIYSFWNFTDVIICHV